MDINNPFETFSKTAFRLEALPEYIVDSEKAAFKEYLSSGKIHDKSASSWAKTVNENIQAGKSLKRLRLISDELTSYEQYELLAYPGIKFGEEIRLNARTVYQDDYQYDFWFFDKKYISQMKYEVDGTYLSSETRIANKEEREMLDYWMSVFEESEIIK
ncbi:MAG: hypothetical protein JWN28_593 [Candidatus Saccharibacteria bacterium]|nr:hypothetical protein [Candidatus Saccharibacteria bacterium]